MPKTPGKMHMYDMVKIDAIVFEIVGGGGAFNPPPGSLAVSNSPDRIGLRQFRKIGQCYNHYYEKFPEAIKLKCGYDLDYIIKYVSCKKMNNCNYKLVLLAM